MSGKLLLIWFLLISTYTSSFAQIEFMKGYIVDSNNQRIDCFIKYKEWKNNPSEFIYKISESDIVKTATASDVREFGVDGNSKYVSAKVKIDRSSDVISQLNTYRNPVWSSEYLFLNTLIHGKISLLSYTDENINRFFYQIGDTIQQLVFKKYLIDDISVKSNYSFRQQLFVGINCIGNSLEIINKVDYNKNDLKKYFTDNNKCMESESIDYSSKIVRDKFNLRITPGVNYSTLSIADPTNFNNILKGYYETKRNMRIGLEAEFVLPFNRNKWGLIIEPNYQTYSSTLMTPNKIFSAEYNSIEIPLGLRYYLFLNENSRFFANVLIGRNIVVKSNLDWGFRPLVASTSADLSIGLGYNFKGIGGEFRYCKNRDILNDYVQLQAGYSRLSFILGIKLF